MVVDLSILENDEDFEEKQKVDAVLVALYFLACALAGYFFDPRHRNNVFPKPTNKVINYFLIRTPNALVNQLKTITAIFLFIHHSSPNDRRPKLLNDVSQFDVS